MRLWHRLGRSGAAAMEFSLTIPILLLIIFGAFQIGMLYFAKAGLANGIGEAARLATLFPTRTDQQIADRLVGASFGVDPAFLGATKITHGVAQGASYTEISVTYTVPVKLVIITWPVITLTESRRVYVP